MSAAGVALAHAGSSRQHGSSCKLQPRKRPADAEATAAVALWTRAAKRLCSTAPTEATQASLGTDLRLAPKGLVAAKAQTRRERFSRGIREERGAASRQQEPLASTSFGGYSKEGSDRRHYWRRPQQEPQDGGGTDPPVESGDTRGGEGDGETGRQAQEGRQERQQNQSRGQAGSGAGAHGGREEALGGGDGGGTGDGQQDKAAEGEDSQARANSDDSSTAKRPPQSVTNLHVTTHLDLVVPPLLSAGGAAAVAAGHAGDGIVGGESAGGGGGGGGGGRGGGSRGTGDGERVSAGEGEGSRAGAAAQMATSICLALPPGVAAPAVALTKWQTSSKSGRCRQLQVR